MADVREQALTAFRAGIDYLANHTLESKWSTTGCGWQEVWQWATRAGFYASCDGIILLDTVPLDDFAHLDFEALTRSVYDEHLCLIVDDSFPAPQDQVRTRNTSTSTTMNVAKFIQASFNRFRPAHSTLTQRYLQKLVAAGRERNGLWGCTLSTPDVRPVLCATVEALVALDRAKSDTDLIDGGLRFLSDVSQVPGEGRRRRIALWAISELLHHADTTLAAQSASRIAREWDLYEDRDDDLEVAKYWNDVISDNGYFSYNARLLFSKATLTMVQHGALDSAYLRYVLPIVIDISTRVTQNGGFYTPSATVPVQFWENYQALDLLGKFLALLRTKATLSEECYVLVKPIHFHKQTFKIEPDLGVVIMPFGKKWSDDVFRVFDETLRKKGYRCWRADLVHKDDAIMQTIWEHINKARFIIADCTDRNPNVFYELGLGDTIGKPVFRCAQDRKFFPFDISGIRSYEYGTLPAELKKLKRELAAFIDSL